MAVLQDICIPQEFVNDEFVRVTKLFRRNGDRIRAGETILEIEASKAVVSIEAGAEGYIEYLCEEGVSLKLRQVAARIHGEKAFAASAGRRGREEAPEEEGGGVEATIYSKGALELISLYEMERSIFRGRDLVGRSDVQQALSDIGRSADALPSADETVYRPLAPVKKAEIGSFLKQGSVTSTVYTHVDFVDRFPERKSNGYLLPVVIQGASALLEPYKELNAFYANGGIAYYQAVRIGLAIDMGLGLKVVKLPDVRGMDLAEIQSTVMKAMKKYARKAVGPQDVQGSTFTISDLSNTGVAFFAPLVSERQAATLGISSFDDRLRRVTLSLSFDHRVTEGKRAAMFLRELKDKIEGHYNG